MIVRKSKFVFILILFIFSSQYIFSLDEFDFNSINFDISNISFLNNTIVLNGDVGNIFISKNNGVNWEQRKIFQTGLIINSFLYENQFVSINDRGEIISSNDSGNTWIERVNLHSQVIAAIRFDGGYLVRTKDSLIRLSNELKKEKSVYNPLKSIFKSDLSQLKQSICSLNNNFYVFCDSGRIKKYDIYLNETSNIDLLKKELGKYVIGNYQLFSDDKFVYFSADSTIYRTTDLNNIELLYKHDQRLNLNYRIINNDIYILESYAVLKFTFYKIIDKTSKIKIIDFKLPYSDIQFYINDFDFINNKLYIVGKNKSLITYDFQTEKVDIITVFSVYSNFTLPDKINTNSYLFYEGTYNFGTFSDCDYTYRTSIASNDLSKILPSSIKSDSSLSKIFITNSIKYKYFDSINQTLYYFGQNGFGIRVFPIFISKDYGANFEILDKPDLNKLYNYYDNNNMPNLQVLKDKFIINSFYYHYNEKRYMNNFVVFNKNFEFEFKFEDSNNLVKYSHFIDTNNFLQITKLMLDSHDICRYTTNGGKKWIEIKTFNPNDSLMYYKELKYKNIDYLFSFYFNTESKIVTLSSLNLSNFEYKEIYKYQIDKLKNPNAMNNALDISNDSCFISIGDTLFFTKILLDKNYWSYLIYPNDGYINRSMKILDDKLFVKYKDSLLEDRIYWLNIKKLPNFESIIQVEDIEFEKQQINDNNYQTKQISIKNESSNTNIVITKIKQTNKINFESNLDLIDSLHPLIIPPNKSFEFNLTFKPNDVKQYIDSIIISSNSKQIDSISIIKGEGIDTLTSVETPETDTEPYFYNYPPYPIPAKSIVNCLIYWDMNYQLDENKIKVYDMYGKNIDSENKIKLFELSNYYGYFTWDCTGIDNGIYFVEIPVGNKLNYIKIRVQR